jgi:hypothetical protein
MSPLTVVTEMQKAEGAIEPGINRCTTLLPEVRAKTPTISNRGATRSTQVTTTPATISDLTKGQSSGRQKRRRSGPGVQGQVSQLKKPTVHAIVQLENAAPILKAAPAKH